MDKSESAYIERRQAPRQTNIKLPAGELTLMYDEQPVSVFQFKDISPFGVCLHVEQLANQDAIVVIRYIHKSRQFEVYGNIVWQERDMSDKNREQYWLGVSFESHRQEQNIALFELLIRHNHSNE